MPEEKSVKDLKKRGLLKVALGIMGALCFLGIVYIFVYHDVEFWKLWMPTSMDNDEPYYNRQLVAVLEFGQPKGYFGYNETHAAVGRFGTWGPMPFLLYALPGLLAGKSVNSMVICNVLFFVAGWTIFVYGAELPGKKQLVLAAILGFSYLPVQYVFSGTSEPLNIFLFFVILGSSAALCRRFHRGWYIVLSVACVLSTLLRGYTVCFWIFPILILWKQKKYVILSVFQAIISLIGFLVVLKLFCAPYLEGEGVDLSGILLLLDGQIAKAFMYYVERCFAQIGNLFSQAVWPTLTGTPSRQGIVFLILMVLEAFVALGAFLGGHRKSENKLRVAALLSVILSQMMMFTLYTLTPATRHGTTLMVVLIGALVCVGGKEIWVCLSMLALNFIAMMPNIINPLPVYAPVMDEQIQVVHASLEQKIQQEKSDNAWDYTLAFAYGDDLLPGYEYAVPVGMGIQFDFSFYISDPANPIYSRYAMVNHGTDAEARLLADGWQEVVSTKDLIVYERPDAVQ